MNIDLTDLDWRVCAVGGPVPPELSDTLAAGIPAVVPGVVHLDLRAAKLIPDPFAELNERALGWVGEVDWEYSATFEVGDSGDAATVLIAEGLDTVAEIRVDGEVVGTTLNQHRTHVVPVLLAAGTHTLAITFSSPLRYTREREAVVGGLPHANAHAYNMLRKSAYNFGWDWGPDLATSGIWRGLRLVGWSGARLAAVHPRITVDDADAGSVRLDIDLDWAPSGTDDAVVRASIAGVEGSVVIARGTTRATIELRIDTVERWWPRGYGAQRRYPLEVAIDGQSASAGSWRREIGFRTAEVRTAKEAYSTSFEIVVNGVPVYIRGANWIPGDTFPGNVSAEKLGASIGDALAANLNLLRVWGGGIYESDAFYELCDAHGILVWQDFLLACAAYPEDDLTLAEIEAEAREHISRLAAHPSHVVWNGGNEDVWGVVDWGWQARIGDRPWGERYIAEVFPRLLDELEAPAGYCANSPWSFHPYRHPNDPEHGTAHIWDVWNTHDYDHYRTYRPRFVSEFGFQGPPNWSTLTAVVKDSPLSTSGEQLRSHQKADQGMAKLDAGLGSHLPLPERFEDWHFATQLNQARAIRTGISWFRSQAPRMAGTIVWQLNDCWPVISWSAVDGNGLRKPMWFALREVSAPRFASIQLDGELLLCLHNDSADAWTASVVVERRSIDGEVQATWSTGISLASREAIRVPIPGSIADTNDPADELLVATIGTGERALWWFEEDPKLRLHSDALEVEVRPAKDAVDLVLSARSTVKDVVISPDRLVPGATVDDNLFTLLAGESRHIRIAVPAGHSGSDRPLAWTDVVRHVGELVTTDRLSRAASPPASV